MDLPKPLQRLRRALLREIGGDRLMAKVLALVLACLTAVPRPANVAAMLQVLTPPIADTARYDRLRNLQEADHEA